MKVFGTAGGATVVQGTGSNSSGTGNSTGGSTNGSTSGSTSGAGGVADSVVERGWWSVFAIAVVGMLLGL